MLKSEKAYRTAKIFLILGIVFAVLTVIVGTVHCMEYSWMPFELIFSLPFAVLLEYVLIGAGVTLLLLGIAWICYGIGGRRAKAESAAICVAEDEAFEEETIEPLDGASKIRAVLDGDSAKRPVQKKKASPVIEKIVVPVVSIAVLTVALILTLKKSTEKKDEKKDKKKSS